MGKLSKFVKPLLIVVLIVVLAVVIITPVEAKFIHLPGASGEGPNSIFTCYCPMLQFVSCGCAILE